MTRNAIILAAGTSSRFVPLSIERPKGLLEVKGEILIERQIRQLHEAGITDITIVVGYKAELFEYLQSKFGVNLVFNEDFEKYNNTSSLIKVISKLGNTFICSSDNYFPENVFSCNPKSSFYSALYSSGKTNEYCLQLNGEEISGVSVGGADCWYMIGHVYFSHDFSKRFQEILSKEYEKEETRHCYWEDIYIKYIKELPPMEVHRYKPGEIEEFDSLDELRTFDNSYISNTRSSILKYIAQRLNCTEAQLSKFAVISHKNGHLVFNFQMDGNIYIYNDLDKSISPQ